MFLLNPPEVRTLEVFTTLPQRYRQPRRTVWSDANQGGRETDSFLEGPVFDGEGNLYVADIPFGRVFRIDPKGEWDLVAQWDVPILDSPSVGDVQPVGAD
jgi:gluconolactonase